MELNTINNTDNWGTTSTRLNENFSKVNTEVEKLKYGYVRCKGLFASLEALQTAYPSPVVGDWAIVGDTVPGDIYRCSTAGTWEATGETGGGVEISIVSGDSYSVGITNNLAAAEFTSYFDASCLLDFTFSSQKYNSDTSAYEDITENGV
ncbi:MAG: hypothetical protein Q4D56_05750 [Bacteroides sp.]|nr:hypothetical protein [Bacteroides sp.]